MKDPVSYFFSHPFYKERAASLKRLLYFFVLFKCAYWLINNNLLFGKHSVIADKEFSIGFVKGLAFFLYERSHQWLCYWAILFLIIICLLGVFKKQAYFICDFIIWLLVVNLHYRVYATLTAGDFLLNQLLLFNCFISFSNHTETNWWQQLKTALHNFGIIAVIAQICLLYLASGITKLQDEAWVAGEAIAITSTVDHFNLFHPIRFSKGPWTAQLLNYLIIFYQLIFPVFIWFQKVKKPLLVIGICIHLYIAFVLGLLSFGLLMLIPYVLFWPQKSVVGSLQKD